MSEYKDKPYSTARYKIIYGSCQNRYRFFCASSGAAVYTSKPIRAETIEEELKQVWERKRDRILINAKLAVNGYVT